MPCSSDAANTLTPRANTASSNDSTQGRACSWDFEIHASLGLGATDFGGRQSNGVGIERGVYNALEATCHFVVAAGSALGTGTAYLWSVVLLDGAVLEYLDMSRLAARRRLSKSGMQRDAFSLGEALV